MTPPHRTHYYTQPPDPITRQTAKLYFKLIQATHHKHIITQAIDTGIFPSGMTRQVIKLTQFIKPAIPTPHTRSRIQDNTHTWMDNNMHILLEHYTTQLTQLTPSNTTFNSTAFQIASGWARKRYHTRFSPNTLQTLQSLLTSQPTPSTDSTQGPPYTSTSGRLDPHPHPHPPAVGPPPPLQYHSCLCVDCH